MKLRTDMKSISFDLLLVLILVVLDKKDISCVGLFSICNRLYLVHYSFVI